MKKLIVMLLLISCFHAKAQYLITQHIAGLYNPVAFTITPGGDFFITEKSGLVKAFDSTGVFIQTVFNIQDSTFDYGECGMLGICLDPQFAVNHYVYIYYNHFDSSAAATQARMRVVRFTEVNYTGMNPLLLFDEPQLGNNHLGGNIHFSNTSTDKLFITIGENTIQANAQLIDNPYGKILRINSDGSIPAGNPFYDDGDPHTGNDDRIWAYGLRNSFDFTFSPLTDSLFATENGPTADDEVNMIHGGANYAWPTFTGVTNNPAYADPIFSWTPTQAPTGILFYSDTIFPQFTNHLLVAVYNNGYIYDLALGNPPAYDTVLSSGIALNFGTGFLNYNTTIRQGTDGCLYILHGGGTGILYKVCPDPAGIADAGNANGLMCEVAPNPVTDVMQLTYKAGAGSKITFKLYDVLGRLVWSAFKMTQTADLQKLQLEPEQFSNGVYMITMEASCAGQIHFISKKLVITH